MKVKTNQGDVELTAEMVCRGMVFAPKDPRDYCLGEGRVFVVGHRDDANGVWRDARDENLGTNVFGADRLLGCDPTVASRADCERYGVHVDAASHGFARLRDGGAVDLRNRVVNGAVIITGAPTFNGGAGERFVMNNCHARVGDRFVGLNADHASPEDVRRLCCGAEEAETIVTLRCFAGVSLTGRVCTLAIGDHDEHEDIAHGVKWSAGAERYLSNVDRVDAAVRTVSAFNANLRATAALAEPRRCPECFATEGQRCADGCPRVIRYKATRCGARPERGQVLVTAKGENRIAAGEERCNNEAGECSGHTLAENFDFFHWSEPATFLDCPICAQRIMPYGDFGPVGFCVYDPKAGKSRSAPVCEGCHRAHGANAAALRWEGDRLVYPGVQWTYAPAEALIGVDFARPGSDSTGHYFGAGAQALPGKSGAVEMRDFGGPVCPNCGGRSRHCCEPIAAAFCVFISDLKRWAAAPAGKRAKQEAPLVALVNACPDGLDPIGWRAAVLAYCERPDRRRMVDSGTWEDTIAICLRRAIDGVSDKFPEAAAAYQRAISPAPKVERQRLTWKTRGPLLAVDRGDE